MVLRANLQNGVWRQAFQEHASLDFGLDDIPIDLVAEVGMRREHCITVPGFAPSHNSNLREGCTLVQSLQGKQYAMPGFLAGHWPGFVRILIVMGEPQQLRELELTAGSQASGLRS